MNRTLRDELRISRTGSWHVTWFAQGHFLGVIRRAIVVAAFAALPGAAAAQVLGPSPMSPEDLRTVYAELLQAHDGFLYTVHMVAYPSEEAARKAWEQLQQPRLRMQHFDKIFKNVTPRTFFLFAVDQPLRDKLVNLYSGERTGPVLTVRGWVIAELVSTRPAPPPKFEEAQASIPNLVKVGVLPSAEQLRTDPALIKRSAVNAVHSVDDLRAAPADLDVNLRTSSGQTLVIRALLTDRTDLLEELLKRGADANACAHKFCPLQLAIYRGSRRGFDLLLERGANPNQRDPSIGVMEGPLAAAAFRGDMEIAGRLLEAGALVKGEEGREPPLVAAAGAAQRQMVELLISKGADVLAITKTAPERTALDAAQRSKNAEFAAWLRGVMLARAKESGQYAWEGWIEQDGTRHALDKPITLKRAPFRIVVRMRPERVLYVAAATDRRLFEEFRSPARDGALFFGGNVSFESNEGKDAFLVVYEPGAPGERWGGSQAWWASDAGTRFTTTTDTQGGPEHAREIRELTVFGAGDKRMDMPVAQYGGKALYLVLGTRIKMTATLDEVFDGKAVELRFSR